MGRIAVALSLCTSVGAFVLACASLNGLSSGGDAGGTRDSTTEENIDEAGVDAKAPPDAGEQGDAAAEANGTDARFCPGDAGPLVYCMDFDEGDAAALDLVRSQADAAVVTGVYVSPPNSLVVTSEAAVGYAGYGVSFPFQPTTARLEFEVRSVTLPGVLTTLDLSFQGSSGTRRLLNILLFSNNGYAVQEYFFLPDGGAAGAQHPTVTPVGDSGVAGWHHVVLTANVNDANQQYFSGLTVDGQVLEANFPLQLTWAEGLAGVSVGVNNAHGGASQTFFDNVRVDFGF